MKKLLYVLLTSFILVGCVTGSHYYQPPLPVTELDNSIIIDKNKEELWKQIIPSLASTFFVINNIDKSSGLINISYNGNPEKYIDCGRLHFEINTPGKQIFDFPGASAYQRYMVSPGPGQLFHMERKLDLEGRINIVVQEIASNRTKLIINTRYIVKKKNHISNVNGQLIQILEDSISFNSGQREKFGHGVETTCTPNGELEKQIISILTGLQKQQ
ncbi:MAG: hypothetical protein AB1641_09755 [Thermodesulfobacteriota bacterium]